MEGGNRDPVGLDGGSTRVGVGIDQLADGESGGEGSESSSIHAFIASTCYAKR